MVLLFPGSPVLRVLHVLKVLLVSWFFCSQRSHGSPRSHGCSVVIWFSCSLRSPVLMVLDVLMVLLFSGYSVFSWFFCSHGSPVLRVLRVLMVLLFFAFSCSPVLTFSWLSENEENPENKKTVKTRRTWRTRKTGE